MLVMLDNGILGHRQFAEPASEKRTRRWGTHKVSVEIFGFRRKPLNSNPKYQAEMDILFTVGRLIREGKIQAFTYSELSCERFAQTIGLPDFDALARCEIKNCEPAIERSRFFSGEFPAYVRKGGKEDRKRGHGDNPISQISFMEWLCSLDTKALSVLINQRALLGLTQFDVESLLHLTCFRKLCVVGNSAKNYPDMFHVWTAQRNSMDVFLTLDDTLCNIARQFAITKEWRDGYPTKILRPSELLHLMGIEHPDPVPIELDRFYSPVGVPQ
ncbi:MAG TPA: hypothetical protein VH139_13980 [Acidobacteriaceae bacterium]|nr:hypothetical protein [Acidobacteriaceae bacterium]